jgi:hypothetical protein
MAKTTGWRGGYRVCQDSELSNFSGLEIAIIFSINTCMKKLELNFAPEEPFG